MDAESGTHGPELAPTAMLVGDTGTPEGGYADSKALPPPESGAGDADADAAADSGSAVAAAVVAVGAARSAAPSSKALHLLGVSAAEVVLGVGAGGGVDDADAAEWAAALAAVDGADAREAAAVADAGTTAARGRSRCNAGVVLYCVCCFFFAFTFFQRVAPAVITDVLAGQWGLDGAGVGSLAASYFWPYAAMQVPYGIAVDALGVQRPLFAAAAVATAGSIVFALAPSLAAAYVGRLLVGIGTGGSWVACMAVASRHFHRGLSRAIGAGIFAGLLGALLGQTPLAYVVDRAGMGSNAGADGRPVRDWRTPMAASAAMPAAVLMALVLMVLCGGSGGGGPVFCVARVLGAGDGCCIRCRRRTRMRGSRGAGAAAYDAVAGVPISSTAAGAAAYARGCGGCDVGAGARFGCPCGCLHTQGSARSCCACAWPWPCGRHRQGGKGKGHGMRRGRCGQWHECSCRASCTFAWSCACSCLPAAGDGGDADAYDSVGASTMADGRAAGIGADGTGTGALATSALDDVDAAVVGDAAVGAVVGAPAAGAATAAAAAAAADDDAGDDADDKRPVLLVALREPRNWFLMTFACCNLASLLAFASLWAPPFLVQARGYSREGAALTASGFLIGWGLGAPLTGWLADSFSAHLRALLCGMAAVAAGATAAVVYVADASPVLLFVLMVVGGLCTPLGVMFTAVHRSNPLRSASTAVALVNTMLMASGAVFQVVVGARLDALQGGDDSAAAPAGGGARVYSAAAFEGTLVLFPILNCVACLAAALMPAVPHRR